MAWASQSDLSYLSYITHSAEFNLPLTLTHNSNAYYEMKLGLYPLISSQIATFLMDSVADCLLLLSVI